MWAWYTLNLTSCVKHPPSDMVRKFGEGMPNQDGLVRCSVGDQPFACRSPRSIGETVGNGHAAMFTELKLEGGLYSSWICPELVCKTIVDVAWFLENLQSVIIHQISVKEIHTLEAITMYGLIPLWMIAQTYLSFHAEYESLTLVSNR
ncbi:hypothetical protein AVEN_142647-1 [Araneus ventricosus]|uniref:Uncharacterized protein n=1 Tax=Araneus ventricosus TaxID=182803 RepID=A0A4Y2UE71_ARAVE|nr:hypothetical protein AVEN_142647-1 [Araneus ventricosus]